VLPEVAEESGSDSASESIPPRTDGAADISLDGGSALEVFSSPPVVGGLSVSVVRLLTLAASMAEAIVAEKWCKALWC